METNNSADAENLRYARVVYKNSLIGKYGLKLSESCSQKELADILVNNFEKKKRSGTYDFQSDTKQFQASLSDLNNFFKKSDEVKYEWEEYKKKYALMPVSSIWEKFLKDAEDQLYKRRADEMVEDVRKKYNDLKNIKDKAKKSMFSRMFFRGGKKRSRKTKKRRR